MGPVRDQQTWCWAHNCGRRINARLRFLLRLVGLMSVVCGVAFQDPLPEHRGWTALLRLPLIDHRFACCAYLFTKLRLRHTQAPSHPPDLVRVVRRDLIPRRRRGSGVRPHSLLEIRVEESSLRAHLATFLEAYNFAKRLKSLRGLTPFECICQLWTEQPQRFRLNPIHHMPGLNICLGHDRRSPVSARLIAAQAARTG